MLQVIDGFGYKKRTKDGREDNYEDWHELDERSVTTGLEFVLIF